MYIAQVFRFKHDFWRYLLGFLVVFIGSQVIGSVPLMIAIGIKAFQGASIDLENEWEIASFFEPNVFLVLILIPFAIGTAGLIVWVKWVHRQPFKTLHSATQRLDFKKIVFSFLLWGGLTTVLIGTDYMLSPEDYIFNFKLLPFLLMFLIAALLIPVQTSFEEYLFRGYLLQGIGAAAKNRWAPLFGTSLLFGLMHAFNPEIQKMGYVVLIAYIGSGLFLAVITLMSEGLELALGFHAANNLVTALLVTSDWTVFQTHSVLKDISEPSAGKEIFISLFILYPVLLFIFARKYKWGNWREKLFGKVLPVEDTMERA